MKKILPLLVVLLGIVLGYGLSYLLPLVWMLWIKMQMEQPDPLASCAGYMAREAPTPPPGEDWYEWVDQEFAKVLKKMERK